MTKRLVDRLLINSIFDNKNTFTHIPIMFDECMEFLNIYNGGTYVDGTLGMGGHTLGILERLGNGTLFAFDKDMQAMDFTKEKLKQHKNIIYINSDFKNILDYNIGQVDGILLDLGVSSYQLDTSERGFSYRFDAPLDMRMDKRCELTAKIVVNNYSKEKLLEILYKYGEESFAKKIVDNIILARKIKPISTTFELKDIISRSVTTSYKISGPFSKTFQAIRIEVNKELENLDKAINDMIGLLKSKGRLLIISFHSLEDRIVKNVFNLHSSNCICDKSLPMCVCHHKADCKVITKKPIIASVKEQKENKRSTSAKLRVIEKL